MVFRSTLTIASLLAVVAVSILWIRSYRAHDQLSCLLRDSRYTVRTDRGRLVLRGPPPHGPMQERATALANQLRNDDIQWRLTILSRRNNSSGHASASPDVPTRPGALANPPGGIDQQSVQRPFLLALEDPHRFVAAHHTLTSKCLRPIQIKTEKREKSFLEHP